MKTIQERILEYLEFKGITPYRFCKDLGLSMGYLDKKGAIGTDKYLKIIEYYSDLSPEWVLMEKGKMIRESSFSVENNYFNEPPSEPYGKKSSEIDYLKNEVQMQQEIIKGLQRENDLLRMMIPKEESKKNLA